MAAINKFEDIKAWQKARVLVKEIYSLTNAGSFAKDYGLKDQIRRADVSIMLNISEGYARKTDKDFARFLDQSHGSAAEVQSILYIALDQKYIEINDFEILYSSVDQVSRMIKNFSKYLRNERPSTPDSGLSTQNNV